MATLLSFPITAQPSDDACGPTCLHAVYSYYGDNVALDEVVAETRFLREGGTLDAFLAQHALKRGYKATIYCYNLSLFDPTWFALPRKKIAKKLQEQLAVKTGPKLAIATKGYLEFLELGGKLKMEDATPRLLRYYLKRGMPIIAGLSSTWLYRAQRELEDQRSDDVLGHPAGHFVVLHGYQKKTREVFVADPYANNPYGEALHQYKVKMERLVAAVLLGVITYDCNLLVIEPGKKMKKKRP